MNFKYVYILFFFINVCGLAQNNRVTSVIIQKVDSTFKSELLKTQTKETDYDSKLFLQQLTNLDISPQSNNILYQLNLAKQKELRSNLGLKLNSTYLTNYGTNIFNLEDNLIMQARLQVGLELDLLKGGYIENRTKANALDYQSKIDNHQLTSSSYKYTYLKQFNSLIYLFNKQKIDLLNRRLLLLETLSKNENALFHKRLLKKEDILETQQRYNQVQALTHIYAPYNKSMDSVLGKGFTIQQVSGFDLNESLILNSIKNDISDDSLKYWVSKLVNSQDRWYNQLQIGAFGRYNYYDMVGTTPDRGFYSVGVNASLPILSGFYQSQKRKPIEIEAKLESIQKTRDFQTEELLNDIYEFRYKLHQFITFTYKKQVFEEQVRLEDVKRSLGSSYYSPLKAVKNIDDVLAIEMELLELKQNLYLKLLRIHEKVPHLPLDSLVKPINMEQLLEKQTELNKSIYVWTSIFEQQEASYIFQYLKYHQFEKVMIAFQRDDAALSKKIKVMQLLKEEQKQIALMIGNNNLLFESNLPKWFDGVLVNYAKVGIDEVHLDVEPQALKEWKDQKELLLQKYINLLEQTKKYCDEKGMKLSVSIPLHYPSEVMEKIFNLTDEVHFMCYENVNIDYLVRKLSAYQGYKDKVSIAIRTEDFKSRKEMEDFGLLLKQMTGIEKITFHDLKRLIGLDSKELKR
jgi:hypothetical protein